MDSLIPRLREIFELTYFRVILVQFAFFMAYGIVSIPAGALLSQIGYKRGMMLGLFTMGIGCLLFYPAAGTRSFELFMLGYFILASGMTVLQVAANPYVAVLGPERTASSRLNLSQAFNSVGTTIAPLVGATFILSDTIKTSDELSALSETTRETYYASEASAVQGPFLLLAASLIVLALVVMIIRLPKLLHRGENQGYSAVLRKPRLMLGALGIFLYVGAEVAIGSFLVNYFLDMDMASRIIQSNLMESIASTLLGSELTGIDKKGVVGAFVALYWGGAMVGRFIGSFLTKSLSPSLVLRSFGISAIVLVFISMSTTGFVSMWSILLVGLFNSIMFPTIFAIAIEGLGDLKPQGSGILCTAIAGGAIVPAIYGFLTDQFGFKLAFILVISCYAYIAWFANKSRHMVN